MNKIKNYFNSNIVVTTSLLIVMLVVFLLETFDGGSTNMQTLLKYGANFNPLVVVQGQWWRLFTAQFVHIGWLHIASNAVMIYYAGTLLEPLIGPSRFLSVFLLSGVGGNLLSLAFGSDVSISAGASTSLFGLFGVVIVLALKLRDYAPIAAVGKQFFALAAINLFLDLFMTQVDIYGHIGGLITGALLGVIIGGGWGKSIFSNKLRFLMFTILVVYVAFTVRTGMVVSWWLNEKFIWCATAVKDV